MTLGEYIVHYCKRTGITHQKFAELCGVSKGYISQLINEKNPTTGRPITPMLETYIKISEAMHITIDKLFREIDDVPIALKQQTHERQEIPKDISEIEYALLDTVHGLSEAKKLDILEFANYVREKEAKEKAKHDS